MSEFAKPEIKQWSCCIWKFENGSRKDSVGYGGEGSCCSTTTKQVGINEILGSFGYCQQHGNLLRCCIKIVKNVTVENKHNYAVVRAFTKIKQFFVHLLLNTDMIS